MTIRLTRLITAKSVRILPASAPESIAYSPAAIFALSSSSEDLAIRA